MHLNSGVVLDQCGVCGGDGSSCISVSRGILTGNKLGQCSHFTYFTLIALCMYYVNTLQFTLSPHSLEGYLSYSCNAGLRHVITFPRQATHAVLGLHHSSTVVVFKELKIGISQLLRDEPSFTSGDAKWVRKHSGMKQLLIAAGPIRHRVAVMVSMIDPFNWSL